MQGLHMERQSFLSSLSCFSYKCSHCLMGTEPPSCHMILAKGTASETQGGPQRQGIKKAEHRKIDAFELWCWRRLESPLDCKEIQPVHPKGDQSWVFIEGLVLKLKLQYFGHLM